jgi:hypothetical protein
MQAPRLNQEKLPLYFAIIISNDTYREAFRTYLRGVSGDDLLDLWEQINAFKEHTSKKNGMAVVEAFESWQGDPFLVSVTDTIAARKKYYEEKIKEAQAKKLVKRKLTWRGRKPNRDDFDGILSTLNTSLFIHLERFLQTDNQGQTILMEIRRRSHQRKAGHMVNFGRGDADREKEL